MIEIIRLGEATTHNAPFEVNRPNGHPVYLLLLVKTAAEFWVDEKWITVNPDTAFLFKPGQKHLYHSTEDMYTDSWAHIRGSQPLTDSHFPYGKPVPLKNPDEYDALFHLLCGEFYGTAPNRPTVLHHLAMALLQKLSSLGGKREQTDIYYQLVNLRTQIYNNPGGNWQVETIAEQMHISPGYFHTMYKKTFLTTCISDVIQSRMEAASDLLLSTAKSVSEIAADCGYHNTEHFLRQFKKNTGITPLQYRKKTTDRSLREPSLCSTTDHSPRNPSLCSTTDRSPREPSLCSRQ